MTTGIIAKKLGMTRMVDASGRMSAVTLLQVETQKITKVLTPERDGYSAVQVGYYVKKKSRLNKPDILRLSKVNIQETFSRFKEFRLEATAKDGVEIGVQLSVKMLEGITWVDVTGVSKGRGFSGAHRRWNAAVGRMSHGSRFHRSPGSLGMRSTPGRTFKNRHQPGQHGNAQRTIQNLEVMDIDLANNTVAVRGSVPGHRDGFVILKPAVKGAVKKAPVKAPGSK